MGQGRGSSPGPGAERRRQVPAARSTARAWSACPAAQVPALWSWRAIVPPGIPTRGHRPAGTRCGPQPGQAVLPPLRAGRKSTPGVGRVKCATGESVDAANLPVGPDQVKGTALPGGNRQLARCAGTPPGGGEVQAVALLRLSPAQAASMARRFCVRPGPQIKGGMHALIAGPC